MSAKTGGRPRRWRLRLHQWITSTTSTGDLHHHLRHPHSGGNYPTAKRQKSPSVHPDEPLSPDAKSEHHPRPVLPTLPKMKTRQLRPKEGGYFKGETGGGDVDDDGDGHHDDDESDISLGHGGGGDLMRDHEEKMTRSGRRWRKASSMPPVPLGPDKFVTVPGEWNQRRVYSLVERRSNSDYTVTLTDFLQDIFNEQMEGNVDYRVRGSNWRAGTLRIDGFQMVVKDLRRQAHLIGLSIVVDLTSPGTKIAERDNTSGLFVIETLRGRLEVRDHLKFGTWIDIIERKQVVARKLSS